MSDCSASCLTSSLHTCMSIDNCDLELNEFQILDALDDTFFTDPGNIDLYLECDDDLLYAIPNQTELNDTHQQLKTAIEENRDHQVTVVFRFQNGSESQTTSNTTGILLNSEDINQSPSGTVVMEDNSTALTSNVQIKMFYCEFADCRYKCTRKSTLMDHCALNHGVKDQYPCVEDGCNYVGQVKYHLRKHFNRKHKAGQIDNIKDKKLMNDCGKNLKEGNEPIESTTMLYNIDKEWDSKKQDTFTCSHCSYMCKEKRLLSYHKKNMHNPNRCLHQCSKCYQVFKQKRSLIGHLKKYHF